MALQLKIVLLGKSLVGKTSIAQTFISDNSSLDNPSTVGVGYLSKAIELKTGTIIKFHIWDTAGQEKYRSLATTYFKGADAAILVYDITKKDTFEEVKFWRNEISKNTSDNLILAVVGNK